MARGSQYSSSSLKTFYASPRTKDLPHPEFKMTTKVNDTYEVQPSERSLSGNFTRCDYHTSTFPDGSVSELFRITLEDSAADERYVIDVPFNNMCRPTMNSLLSLEKKEVPYHLSIYLKERESNGKTYPDMKVFDVNAKKGVSWKYEIKDLPKVEYVEVNKKKVGDYGAINDFYRKEMLEKFTPDWFGSNSNGDASQDAADIAADVFKDDDAVDAPF